MSTSVTASTGTTSSSTSTQYASGLSSNNTAGYGVNPTGLSSTGSLSGSINFSGLGSGTDFNSIIDQLVKIESLHENQLTYWKSTWQAKIQSMQSLNTYMSNLQTAAKAMNTAQTFNARTAASSDSTKVTATCDNTAANGSHQVVVGSSIMEVLRSTGCADAGTTAYGGAGGTLNLSIGTTNYSVAVLAGDTLNNIASKINTAVGSSVATVESDNTSSNPYHLVLTSTTGGSSGKITVTQNPTDLSFDTKNVALQSYNTWTGTSTVGVSGQYTGDKANGTVPTYTFTVNSTTSPATVGTDAFTITWTSTANPVVNGSISVPANYTAGQELAVENGFSIKLAAGTVNNGDSFTMRAHANNIDSAETGTWSGPAITTGGNYLGAVSKTYSFSVITGATLGGNTPAVLRWTDSTGGTGTVSVAAANTAYSVDDGVKLQFAAGTLTGGDNFQVQVFAPEQQQAQDKGLAQVAKVVHGGFSDTATTPITTTAGSFNYTYAGKTTTLAVAAGTTLSQLVNAINSDTNNPGVTASVINDGQGLPTSYKLVLTGNSAGAQNQFTSISQNLTALSTGGTLGGGFDTSQSATNSMVKVDGYPSGSNTYLQRSSNQISDVITGVTLNLADAGSAVVTVSTDTSAILSKIQALVSGVNYAKSYIQEQTKYDDSTKEAGILVGNYAFYIIQSTLDSALNDPISGLTDGTDTYTTLAQVGIHTDPDNNGAWTIDSTTLQNALDSNPDAVANLFIQNTTKNSTGVAQRMYTQMTSLTDSQNGMLNVLISNYNDIINNINDQIDFEDKRIAQYKQDLQTRFATLESTLSTMNGQSTMLTSAIAQLPSKTG